MAVHASPWNRRIERAGQLVAEAGPAASLLRFYAAVLRQQQEIFDALDGSGRTGAPDGDMAPVLAAGRRLLQVVAETGPEQLVREARDLLDRPEPALHELLLSIWRAGGSGARSDPGFFPKALLQPYLEWLGQEPPGPMTTASTEAENRCVRCGGAPQLSILETGGAISADGSSRHLQCAACLTSWKFRRVMCPSCGNEDERTLVYFQSPTFPHVRVDVCERCRRYLKTIDLGRLGVAVPLVDEVGAASLDLWAREHGYEKIELNLVGL